MKDLKSAILKMDDKSVTRESVEKLQAQEAQFLVMFFKGYLLLKCPPPPLPDPGGQTHDG
jgi:hypothetical protein